MPIGHRSGRQRRGSRWPGFATVKLCVTVGAASLAGSPAWLAAIVHVPAATRETVLPDTEQTSGVTDENVTGSPELAVALTAKGALP